MGNEDGFMNKTSKQKLLAKALNLYELYQSGKIERLAQHEVHPDLLRGERANYLYFTLPVAINFQRSSPSMWQSALKTWNDPKTRYVFFPEKLTVKKRDVIQRDLLKYRLAVQTNKHPDIWIKISDTLNKYFESNPKKVLGAGDMNVEKVLQIVQHDRKSDFPYLSGVKMSNYWLYILNQFTDAKLKNMNKISIIPDTHVIQSSVRLGLVKKNAEPGKVALAWNELLEGSEVNPVDMHPVLWNWSRNSFKPGMQLFRKSPWDRE